MQPLKRFQKLIDKARNILITTHEYPDADGIGSQVALCMALNSLGKKVVCVNEEALMERYRYLDPHNLILSFEQFSTHYNSKENRDKSRVTAHNLGQIGGKQAGATEACSQHVAGSDSVADSQDGLKCEQLQIDLFIITDTNDLKRIGPKMQKLAANSKELLFIDHHPAPEEMQAMHYIDTTVAATGELVGNLIEELGIPLDRELALALYTSILIDTNSFRYPTVRPQTHHLISKLLSTGIKPSEAYKKIYGDKKITYLRFLGKKLSNVQASQDGKIAWIQLTKDDLQESDIDPEDTHSFVNHMLILQDLKVACVFRQIGNKVKVSLRSTGDTNVNQIALKLGGGGHNHSAAAILNGPLENVVKDVVARIEAMLKADS